MAMADTVNLLGLKDFDTTTKDTSDKENESQPQQVSQPDEVNPAATHDYLTIAKTDNDGTLSRVTIRQQRRLGEGRRAGRWNQCVFCTKEFRKPSDLVRHMRIHTREKPFKCKYCGRSFTVRSTLTAHLRTHLGGGGRIRHNKPYDWTLYCTDDNDAVVKPYSQFDADISCSLCDKKFSCDDELRRHVADAHPVVEEGEREPEAMCDVGGRVTTTAPVAMGDNLDCGVVVSPTVIGDGTESNVVATQLAATTAEEQAGKGKVPGITTYELEQPIYVNDGDGGVVQLLTVAIQDAAEVAVSPTAPSEGDRLNKCPHCPAGFRKSSHLKVHVRTHTGERPYACPHCPRSFATASVLKGHQRTHIGVKTHRCEQCGKYLTTRSSLRRHMEVHSEAPRSCYVCRHCSESFRTRTACCKHIAAHHQEHQPAATSSAGEVEGEEVEVAAIAVAEAEDILGAEEAVAGQEAPEGEEATSVAEEMLQRGTILVDQQEYTITTNRNGELAITQTLHADSTGTITLPSLIGQDGISQANLRDIEETLNQQLLQLGSTPELASLGSEEAILVEKSPNPVALFRNFQHCVFSSINTLPEEQLELEPEMLNGATFILPEKEIPEDNNLSCETCKIDFETSAQLQEHTQMHEKWKLDRTCELCDKTFTSVANYRLHVRSHGREKEHECYLCSSRFATQQSLGRHMESIHGEDKYICSMCHCSFRTARQLTRHQGTERCPAYVKERREEARATLKAGGEIMEVAVDPHGAVRTKRRRGWREKRRRRDQVKQLTEEEARAVMLMPQHSASVSEKVLIASVIEKDRISDMKELGAQPAPQEPQHPNQCAYCPKSFRKPSDLVRHLRTHTGERPFHCPWCGKCFTVKSTLDSHLKTHTEIKHCPVCHVCGRTFATKGSLKVHMRLHTGSRPFRCPMCDQRFRTSGHRKAHLVSHMREATAAELPPSPPPPPPLPPPSDSCVTADEEQQQLATVDSYTDMPIELSSTLVVQGGGEEAQSDHPCTVCAKRFNQHSSLIRHMRIHTGERPFKCDVCHKAFNQNNALAVHALKHTGVRPWACPQCGHTATQKGNLKTHMRRAHMLSSLPKEAPPPQSLVLTLDLERVVTDLFPQMSNTTPAD